MSTIPDLQTDLVAMITGLASTPVRATSDHNDLQGQVLVADQWYFRLRLTALEEAAIDSNTQAVVVQMELDMMVRMAQSAPNPRDESSYYPAAWADQVQLIDVETYKALASVLDVPIDTVPQVVEGIARNGNVLLYQVAANLALQP